MRLHANRDVQIAGGAAHCVPALPLPATRRREPVCAPGGMRTSTVSDVRNAPVAVAGGTDVAQAGPLPSQRGQVRLNFIAPPSASRCRCRRIPGKPLSRCPAAPAAVAGLADLLARDVQPHLRAADGLPEIDVQAVFEIGALFRAGRRLGSPPRPPKNWLKMSRKRAGAARARRRVRPPPADSRIRKNRSRRNPCPGLRCARARAAAGTARRNVVRIETVLIVNLALLRHRSECRRLPGLS